MDRVEPKGRNNLHKELKENAEYLTREIHSPQELRKRMGPLSILKALEWKYILKQGKTVETDVDKKERYQKYLEIVQDELHEKEKQQKANYEAIERIQVSLWRKIRLLPMEFKLLIFLLSLIFSFFMMVVRLPRSTISEWTAGDWGLVGIIFVLLLIVLPTLFVECFVKYRHRNVQLSIRLIAGVQYSKQIISSQYVQPDILNIENIPRS